MGVTNLSKINCQNTLVEKYDIYLSELFADITIIFKSTLMF